MRRLLAILAVVFLVSCSGTTQEQTQVSLESPFIGGTQGIVLSFQDLRKDVFDGGKDPFDIVLKVENKGETLIGKNAIRVKLSGFNPSEFSKTESDLTKNAPDDVIEMRKDANGAVINSQPTFVEFTNLNHNGLITGAQAQFSVRAEACYLYRTKAVSKLCIRKDLLTPETGGICELNQDKQIYSSGAPVQISTFKESTRAKDKVGFTFDVKNANSGLIFERNSACDRTSRRTEDRVYVIVSSGLPGLQCTGLDSTEKGAEGFVTLYSGQKTVSCTQQVNSNTDFEQLVNIEAIYDYEQIVQSSIVVKNSEQ